MENTIGMVDAAVIDTPPVDEALVSSASVFGWLYVAVIISTATQPV